jgi:hypothetical protein
LEQVDEGADQPTEDDYTIAPADGNVSVLWRRYLIVEAPTEDQARAWRRELLNWRLEVRSDHASELARIRAGVRLAAAEFERLAYEALSQGTIPGQCEVEHRYGV